MFHLEPTPLSLNKISVKTQNLVSCEANNSRGIRLGFPCLRKESGKKKSETNRQEIATGKTRSYMVYGQANSSACMGGYAPVPMELEEFRDSRTKSRIVPPTWETMGSLGNTLPENC